MIFQNGEEISFVEFVTLLQNAEKALRSKALSAFSLLDNTNF